MKKEINNIAIVRLSALGDIINCAIVLQFIRQEYPNAKVHWIIEEMFSPILNEVKYLNKIHTVNLKKFKKEKSLPQLLQTIKEVKNIGNFDLIIDMQDSLSLHL